VPRKACWFPCDGEVRECFGWLPAACNYRGIRHCQRVGMAASASCTAGRVDGVGQAKALATNDRCRSYCGRTGDKLLPCLMWPDGPGSLTTCTKNSSIWRTAFMNWSKSTGLVT